MDGSTRRTRFETRVMVERDFLSLVNARFGSVAPVAGMTKDAIESWKSRALKKISDTNLVQEVYLILLEASSRAELMSDNSKDVFEPNQRPKLDSVMELKSLLEDSLGKI